MLLKCRAYAFNGLSATISSSADFLNRTKTQACVLTPKQNKTQNNIKYHDKAESDGVSMKERKEKARKLLLFTQFHDNKSSQ